LKCTLKKKEKLILKGKDSCKEIKPI